MRARKKSDSSEEFALVAAEYCALVGRAAGKPHAFLEEAARLLAQLYHHALTLPEVPPESYDEAVRRMKPDAQARRLLTLKKKLGAEDSYWETLQSEEAIQASISDNLASVWRDLEEGLVHWKAGRHANAIWSWRISLKHWGRKATGALRAIHEVLTAAAP